MEYSLLDFFFWLVAARADFPVFIALVDVVVVAAPRRNTVEEAARFDVVILARLSFVDAPILLFVILAPRLVFLLVATDFLLPLEALLVFVAGRVEARRGLVLGVGFSTPLGASLLFFLLVGQVAAGRGVVLDAGFSMPLGASLLLFLLVGRVAAGRGLFELPIATVTLVP